MSGSEPDDTPRDEYAPRPAVPRNSPKPRDGRCQCCGLFVGRTALVWDHCHLCQIGRGWTCDPCNTALTEHLIEHLDKAQVYLGGHVCDAHPALFDAPRVSAAVREQRSQHTRPLYLNNGSGDGRIVNVSRHKGRLSIEQVAVVLGVSTPTARDLFNGRRGTRSWAADQKDGTYLPLVEEVVAIMTDRLKRGLL